MQKERELKYFIDGVELRKLIDLSTLPVVQIYQAYFSNSLIQKYLLKYYNLSDAELTNVNNFKNGRIRSITSNQVVNYFVTVKGPMEENFSRIELETEISQNDFIYLEKLVDQGSIKKNRFFLKPQINLDKFFNFEFEIDQIIDVNNFKDLDDFYTIDLELPEATEINLTELKQSFNFLQSAILLTGTDLKLRKYLGMRFLAKNNYSETVQKIVSEALKNKIN